MTTSRPRNLRRTIPFVVLTSLALTVFSGCGGGGSLSGGGWAHDFTNGFSGRGNFGVTVYSIRAPGPAGFIAAAGGDITSLAFTPSFSVFKNSKIAYASSRTGNWDIYVMDYDGTNARQLTSHPATDRNPCITADGTKVFFESNRTGTFQIWVINADGTGERQLTFTSTNETQPHVSRDGTTLAFTSTRFGNSEIMLMGSDGLNQRRVTDHPALDEQPQISPDGQWLCWVSTRSSDGRRHIWRMNLFTGATSQVTSGSGAETDPRWSPDGQVIAFVSMAGWIYTIRPDGTNVTPILTGLPVRSQPDFSPDGQKIIYTADLGNNLDIFVANRDGSGTPTQLTFEPTFENSPSVSGSALPRRVYVGAQGSDMGRNPAFGTSIGGFIASLLGSEAREVIAFDGTTRANLTVIQVSFGEKDPVGVEVTGALITGMWQDNGRNLTPTRIIGTGGLYPATTDLVLLYFDPQNGRLVSVIPIGRGRASGLQTPFLEHDRVVIRGAILAALDIESRTNLAPEGAVEVRLDTATGRIVSVQ